MSILEQPKHNNSPKLDKFHEIEIQKVFETMLSLQTFRLQLGTFFGTANLTALGIAFSFQKAGIILLAAVSLWIWMILDVVLRGAFFRYYYRALILQEMFAPEDNNTFLDIFLPTYRELQIRQIAKMPNPEERIKALQKISTSILASTGIWLPIVGSVTEIIFGIALWLVLGWSLF